MEKKDWREIFAGFGLWSLVEDISEDGDGKEDKLQLTKDGELLLSDIEQEIEKAREEGKKEYIKMKIKLLKKEKKEIERILKDTSQVYPEDILSMERDLLHISQEIKIFERDLIELSKLKQ